MSGQKKNLTGGEVVLQKSSGDKSLLGIKGSMARAGCLREWDIIGSGVTAAAYAED